MKRRIYFQKPHIRIAVSPEGMYRPLPCSSSAEPSAGYWEHWACHWETQKDEHTFCAQGIYLLISLHIWGYWSVSSLYLIVPRGASQPPVMVYKDQCDLTSSVSIISITLPQFYYALILLTCILFLGCTKFVLASDTLQSMFPLPRMFFL